MSPHIGRLLERLQTGWQPTADKIDREIAQRDFVDWDFWKSGGTLIGYAQPRFQLGACRKAFPQLMPKAGWMHRARSPKAAAGKQRLSLHLPAVR